ncbi:MAG TPA: hypothetical protein VHV52_00620, partial [Gaiellaceae bacterium]|nr:hypothetical protein [Gaiellaceae bacterium]
MTLLRSVGGRLSLALLTVVVGVLAIVYLIVVPSYQRSLENAELRSLTSSLEHVVLPNFPTTETALQPYAVGRQPLVNARVVVFNEFSAKGTLEPYADSSTEQEAIENDPVAL